MYLLHRQDSRTFNAKPVSGTLKPQIFFKYMFVLNAGMQQSELRDVFVWLTDLDTPQLPFLTCS